MKEKHNQVISSPTVLLRLIVYFEWLSSWLMERTEVLSSLQLLSLIKWFFLDQFISRWTSPIHSTFLYTFVTVTILQILTWVLPNNRASISVWGVVPSATSLVEVIFCVYASYQNINRPWGWVSWYESKDILCWSHILWKISFTTKILCGWFDFRSHNMPHDSHCFLYDSTCSSHTTGRIVISFSLVLLSG